jgi:amidase
MAREQPDELIWADAVAQATAIRSGRASASELLEVYLDRIERHDPTLRAYVTVDVEGAREGARAADDALRHTPPAELPPFHGVTLSVKDVVDVAGLPTTHSSKVLADHRATADDPVVERFREAGFVILGKTNVPEFCSSMTDSELNGTCRNPWDPELTPGGSSGGAGAALSAGLCAIAHGTDGAGSVRAPASFCGLVGLKPTRGLSSFGPESGNAYYGTAVNGVLSRSVRDAATMLDVLLGPRDPAASWSPRSPRPYADEVEDAPRPLRIAVSTMAPMGVTEDQCAEAARRAADLLARLGHEVEQATPAWDVILAASAGPMEVPGAAALVAADQLGSVEPRNRPMIERLAQLTIVEHAQWVEQARAAATAFLEFWDAYDVLVTPTIGIPPPAVSWAPWDQDPEAHMATFMGFPNFAQPFNVSGQPALNVPLTWNPDGLPIGVQLAGRRLDDGLLLQVARQLETAQPWSDRRPAQFA